MPETHIETTVEVHTERDPLIILALDDWREMSAYRPLFTNTTGFARNWRQLADGTGTARPPGQRDRRAVCAHRFIDTLGGQLAVVDAGANRLVELTVARRTPSNGQDATSAAKS